MVNSREVTEGTLIIVRLCLCVLEVIDRIDFWVRYTDISVTNKVMESRHLYFWPFCAMTFYSVFYSDVLLLQISAIPLKNLYENLFTKFNGVKIKEE